MKDSVLEQKQAVISEIREKIENSGSLVLVDYRGLTVEQVTDLRKKYREAGVQYKVYKNTMMKLAFKELGFEDGFADNDGLTSKNLKKMLKAMEERKGRLLDYYKKKGI